jgi:hypothetical protein
VQLWCCNFGGAKIFARTVLYCSLDVPGVETGRINTVSEQRLLMTAIGQNRAPLWGHPVWKKGRRHRMSATNRDYAQHIHEYVAAVCSNKHQHVRLFQFAWCFRCVAQRNS